MERSMGLCAVCGKHRMLVLTGACRECEDLIDTLERENLLPGPKPEFINDRLLRVLKARAKQ